MEILEGFIFSYFLYYMKKKSVIIFNQKNYMH